MSSTSHVLYRQNIKCFFQWSKEAGPESVGQMVKLIYVIDHRNEDTATRDRHQEWLNEQGETNGIRLQN